MKLTRIDSTHPIEGPHQPASIYQAGAEAEKADLAFVMVHGRGATAPSILQLGNEFAHHDRLHFRAPQAYGNTWYPYSFLAPTDQNQPGLDSGLQAVFDTYHSLKNSGFEDEQIFFLGFSQGGCLVTEFVARHPKKYAGLIVLSGGVIGAEIDFKQYSGNLQGMPVFMGCSDTDPHIPKLRLLETEKLLTQLGANVTLIMYPGMGHLVNEDEIEHINDLINFTLN